MPLFSLRGAWARTPLVAAPVTPLLIGVTLGQVIAWFTDLLPLITCATCFGALALMMPQRLGRVSWGVCLGLIPCLVSTILQPTGVTAEDAQLLVRLIEPPLRRKPGEVTFVAEELGTLRRRVRCRAVDLPWRNAAELGEGDVAWVRGAVTPVRRPLNPFGWQASLWRKGIAGEMKVLFVSHVLAHGEGPMARAREAIGDRVREISGESRGGALLLSMAFGFGDLISKTVEDLFKEVGLSHLLVVSGYQVSLVFGLVYGGLTRVLSRALSGIWLRYLIALLSLVAAAFYVLLVGMEMSSIRAFIAASFVCSALFLDRRPHFFQGVGVALLFLQLFWPWALFDLGVLLTFAALCGIGVGRICGAGGTIRTLIWINVAVWVFTTLVIVLWGGGVAPSSLLANIVFAGPWSVLNCTLGVSGVALAFVSLTLGAPLVRLVSWINEGIVRALLDHSGNFGFVSEVTGTLRWAMIGSLTMIATLLCATALARSSRGQELSLVR